MIRRLFGKLMWLGRATSALVGLVVLFALAIGAANSALAHTNIDTKLFHLGHNNPVGRLSALTGTLTGALLKLDNNGTGPALLLEAGTDAPPLKVNAAAGTATNLSADELDGKDSSEFYAAGSKVADSTHAEQADSATEAQNAANADTLDSLDSADFQRRVSGQCAPGSSIRAIGADGTTLACEQDDDSGAAQVNQLRSDLGTDDGVPNQFSDLVSFSKVKHIPNSIINGNATTLDSLDSTDLQRRVGGQCPTGHSIRVVNADGTVTCESDDGGGKAPDSELLDGKDSTQFANATHAHSGADITSGTVAETRIDGAVARDAEVMPTVKANDGAGSGVDADTIDGQNSSAFASSSHNHDDRYYTEGEVNTALSGKANTTHQHSGSDITSGTVEADRIEDGPGTNLNADQLDHYDARHFGLEVFEKVGYVHTCDTPDTWNQCAPVTINVPSGQVYRVSVWSSFSARAPVFTSREVGYCSAGAGPGLRDSLDPHPCLQVLDYDRGFHKVRVHDYDTAASSFGEAKIGEGSYKFYTAIKPSDEFQDTNSVVTTKVMITNAFNPDP